MRIEATGKEDQYKVWATDGEIEQLRRETASYRDDILIQLGAYVGLRAFEMPQIRPIDIKETESGQYRLHVRSGKDTTGTGGKPRDAYLPADVERELQKYQNAQNIAPKEPYINLSERGVRAAIKRTAEATADATGKENYRHLSSHDLRRRFAQRLLVDREMNPRVVMAVGGWDSFQAIEPYLNAPTEDVVDDAFQAAGLE